MCCCARWGGSDVQLSCVQARHSRHRRLCVHVRSARAADDDLNRLQLGSPTTTVWLPSPTQPAGLGTYRACAAASFPIHIYLDGAASFRCLCILLSLPCRPMPFVAASSSSCGLVRATFELQAPASLSAGLCRVRRLLYHPVLPLGLGSRRHPARHRRLGRQRHCGGGSVRRLFLAGTIARACCTPQQQDESCCADRCCERVGRLYHASNRMCAVLACNSLLCTCSRHTACTGTPTLLYQSLPIELYCTVQYLSDLPVCPSGLCYCALAARCPHLIAHRPAPPCTHLSTHSEHPIYSARAAEQQSGTERVVGRWCGQAETEQMVVRKLSTRERLPVSSSTQSAGGQARAAAVIWRQASTAMLVRVAGLPPPCQLS